METLVPLVMPVGWATVLVVAVISLTKIIVIAMVIRGVPTASRAEVLRAAGSFFISRRAKDGHGSGQDE